MVESQFKEILNCFSLWNVDDHISTHVFEITTRFILQQVYFNQTHYKCLQRMKATNRIVVTVVNWVNLLQRA
jgi:hypothetical protein